MRDLNDDVIQDPAQYDHLYFFGLENKAIRYYYYLNGGLNILNQFRNVFFGIFAVYFTLHLTNPVLLAILFIASTVICTVIGYYNTHTMNKVMEWLGMRFASHYAIRQFNYQQGIYETLQEVLQLLHEDKKARLPSNTKTTEPRGRDTKKPNATAKRKIKQKGTR